MVSRFFSSGSWVVGAYFLYLGSVDVAAQLAGLNTKANIKADINFHLGLKHGISLFGISLGHILIAATVGGVMFGFAGIRYGQNQARFRKNKVQKLQDRIIVLESGHDTNRTSSNLTPRGETNPGDKL